MNKNTTFISLLKKYTNIDRDFINTFFKKFKIGEELNFDIIDVDVAKYLEISLPNLRKRLLNDFSKVNFFYETVDYIKVKTNKTSSLTYMINYPCFERLAMRGVSEQSETVRMYFIKLRQFIVENQEVLYQALENKDDLRKYEGYESIYFFVIDERHPTLLKVGRTRDIIRRLRNYNVGRIKEVDLKYFAIVKNNVLIENCIKIALQKNRFSKNKEIYEVDPKLLKKVIDKCYCKHVSSKENEKLYEEISELLGLYAYTKDKVNIKPYIIIGNNI